MTQETERQIQKAIEQAITTGTGLVRMTATTEGNVLLDVVEPNDFYVVAVDEVE